MIILDYFYPQIYVYIKNGSHEQFLKFMLEERKSLTKKDIPIYYFTKEKTSKLEKILTVHSFKTLNRLLNGFIQAIVFIEDNNFDKDIYTWNKTKIYILSSKEKILKESLKQLLVSGENLDYSPYSPDVRLYSY